MKPLPSTKPPRVAITGFFLECNRWAPVTTASMFAQATDIAGEALGAELRSATPRLLPDTLGFTAAMDRMGQWEPIPLRCAGAQPGGPVDHAYFEALVDDIEARLRAQAPVDAVFISSHGAALTTCVEDPDGLLFARIRAVVGPDVPVVAVLDLHTNVSQAMTEALSGFVAYRSNPHADLRERGEEAAVLLRGFLQDGPGCVALTKLPLVAPATSQLIAPGTVYAELIEESQKHVQGDVLNVSLCGGFALADSAKCGFSVVVTARQGMHSHAQSLSRRLAERVWEERHRFVTELTPLQGAVTLALQCGLDSGPPLILADVADNPGAGGGGNTTDLLGALLRCGASGVVLGVFTDAALAHEAHSLGLGARFEAVFNRHIAESGATAAPGVDCLRHSAQVLALSDGHFVGRRGFVAGTHREMGPSVLLELGGVRVAVISHRQQLLDPAQLDVLGVDMSTVRTLVVKSRGHFRAAFTDFAPPERIVEVDCPGLTTPNLATLAWRHLPRPMFPIDPDTRWLAD